MILFFLLSGFLMEQTTAADASLFTFAIRRAARILPMYWTSMLLAQFIGGPFDTKTIASNAAFASDLTHTVLMCGVYWTLYVEVRFYAIVPILRLAGESSIKVAPYAAIAFNSILFIRSGQASHLVLYVTYCLLGMQISLWQRARLSTALLAICIASVAANAFAYTPEHGLVGLAPLVGSAIVGLALVKKINAPYLAFIGRVSYSWYLLHTLIGSPVLAYLIQVGFPDWFASLLVTIVTLGVATTTFHLIETPCISLGKTIVRLFRTKVSLTLGR